jgi:hypothetical protein
MRITKDDQGAGHDRGGARQTRGVLRRGDGDVSDADPSIGVDQTFAGLMSVGDSTISGLEIACHDPATDPFPSHVYSNIAARPLLYHWNAQCACVTDWTAGSKCIGTLSADFNRLSGGWRGTAGNEASSGYSCDATMTSV